MTDKSELYPTSDPANMTADHGYHPSEDDTFSKSNDTSLTDSNLLDTIQSEILPRLMLVHSSAPHARPHQRLVGAEIEPDLVDAFVSSMLDHSSTSGNEIVSQAIRDGVPLETIYLDLLAPAARQMGELWERDIRNFTDVTIGLCRLHEVLRHNSLQPHNAQITLAPDTPSVLLSTACEDQHVFGIIMVAEFFRKEGWQVTCEPGASDTELQRISALHNYDVIGLSIARSIESSDLAEVIQNLRTASRNPDVKIILGGALIQRDLGIASKVGADGAITDASRAPAAAMSLLAHTRVSC